MPDLEKREYVLLVPLVLLVLWLGVSPSPVMDKSAASVDRLVQNYHAALERAAERKAPAPLLPAAETPEDQTMPEALPQVPVESEAP
jgi:hypothetical protein